MESSPIRMTVSDRYLYGGIGRLSGAGLFLNTRPARSKVEPWQGHRKPWIGAELRVLVRPKRAGRRAAEMRADADGDQVFGLERAVLVARPLRGRILGALRLRIGDFAVGLLDRLQHLRCPAQDPHRHTAPLDASSSRPARSQPTSNSTGAPAAFARSDGAKEETNGTAIATAPAPPTAAASAIALRRSLSTPAGASPAGSEVGVDMKTPKVK